MLYHYLSINILHKKECSLIKWQVFQINAWTKACDITLSGHSRLKGYAICSFPIKMYALGDPLILKAPQTFLLGAKYYRTFHTAVRMSWKNRSCHWHTHLWGRYGLCSWLLGRYWEESAQTMITLVIAKPGKSMQPGGWKHTASTCEPPEEFIHSRSLLRVLEQTGWLHENSVTVFRWVLCTLTHSCANRVKLAHVSLRTSWDKNLEAWRRSVALWEAANVVESSGAVLFCVLTVLNLKAHTSKKW